ncbi:MAG: glycosyltransferase family 39 protein [Candidatus Eisenbacteria bacterium]|nr:glycosyltransferase family 39 protein [Candidatus Eisenbacteria bacterium]
MFQRADPSRRRPRSGPRPGAWLLMLAVAVGLRVAYAWIAAGPHARPFSDPADYDTVAWNLARGAGFSLEGAAGPYPTAFVPPALPWITSLLYRAVGHDYFAAVLLQCAIGGLLPLLVSAFAGAMFGGAVGRLAGWLAAVHPLLVFFSGYLLTESLFCVALLLALTLSAEWVKTPGGGRALGTGIAWGLATLTRPTALLLPAVVAAWAWVPLGLTVSARGRVRQLALLLLGLALTVGPWTLRNALVLHAFVPVTTGAGGALLASNNAEVWGDATSRGGATSGLWDRLTRTEFRGLSETEVDARARARAVAFLRAHVAEWPAMAAAKLSRFWRVRAEGGTTGSWQRAGSPLARVLRRVDPLLLWSVVVLPLALWGAALSLRGPRRWFQSLGLWVVLCFTLLGVVFFGSLRMRVPVEPLVVMFAAAGFEDLRRRARSRARGFRVIEGTPT